MAPGRVLVTSRVLKETKEVMEKTGLTEIKETKVIAVFLLVPVRLMKTGISSSR